MNENTIVIIGSDLDRKSCPVNSDSFSSFDALCDPRPRVPPTPRTAHRSSRRVTSAHPMAGSLTGNNGRLRDVLAVCRNVLRKRHSSASSVILFVIIIIIITSVVMIIITISIATVIITILIFH